MSLTRLDLRLKLVKTGLSHRQASKAVTAVFEAMTEALKRHEEVELPFGVLRVHEKKRKPTRGWFLNRVLTTHKRRNTITLVPNQSETNALSPGSHNEVCP